MLRLGNDSRLRVSFLINAVLLAVLIVAYAVASISSSLRENRETPRLAMDSLVKALCTYYRQTGRFPSGFGDLQGRVWKERQVSQPGRDDRQLSAANYCYIYYPADARTCTIWVIPTGPRREKGSSFFLILTPDRIRFWKGAPLTLDEIRQLQPVPEYRELAALAMTEQNPLDLRRRK